MSVRLTIVSQFEKIAREQRKTLAPLVDDLPLLDSGLDSLCFAILIARLEDEFSADPYSTSPQAPLLTTFGEFVKLYEDALT
jgi:acyl carrier protein